MTHGLTLGLLLCLAGAARAHEPDEPRLQLRAVGELGFVGVHANVARFSTTGTLFRYTEEGGQDLLYPWRRLSAELTWSGRHTAILMYQPLEIDTQVVLRRDVVVDDLTFPAGTPVDLRYGFPFYRASYLYDLLKGPGRELSVGGSLQLRDANIVFSSADCELRRAHRSLGPVPLLKVRGRWALGRSYWWGFEADGIYAPIEYLNGSENEATGALLDLSLRGGVRLTDSVDVFLNLRYLGGGARSTEEDPEDIEFGDGFASNWIDLATVSLGAVYRLPVDD
jgi:hypothetical protein